MADRPASIDDLGPNAGLIDEMYRLYLENPEAVSPGWRDFFADYQPRAEPPAAAPTPAPAPAAAPQQAPAPAPAPAAAPAPAPPAPQPAPTLDGERAEPLRGASARVVQNMEASLAVPTATSVRAVPAKLLEVNRQILNNQLARAGRQGELHAPHRLRRRPGAAEDAAHERELCRHGRQAQRGPPRARQSRARDRPAEERRHAHAARPEHQERRHARLRGVPRRVRGSHPPGAHEQAHPRRLRGHDRVDHQPRHDRHDALGAATHARPGRDRRRRRDHLPARIRGRRSADTRRDRREQGRHAHEHVRPPDHPRGRERRVPRNDARPAARRRRVLRRAVRKLRRAVRARRAGRPTASPSKDPRKPRTRSSRCSS